MNKLPWFTHDHDAHEDTWIRHLIRTEGHVAGWLWWVILELFHKHGNGDFLNINISDVAKAGLTSSSVVTRVVTQMATEYGGKERLSFTLVGTQLLLKINKFRERQAKLKIKTPSRLLQDSFKTPIEGEREEHILTSNAFASFWESYPRHSNRTAALKAWNKLAPSAELIPRIMAAVSLQKNSDMWTKEDGKYIPYPSTWLNNARWEDEPTQQPAKQKQDNYIP